MAQLTIKLPKELEAKIAEATRKCPEAIDAAVQAGCDVMYPIIKTNLQAAIKGDKSTGELARSLGTSPVKVDKNGIHNAKIGFKEPRSNGKSNAMIANILEYGKAGKQAPRPFLAQSKKTGNKRCREAMKKAFEDKIGG